MGFFKKSEKSKIEESLMDEVNDILNNENEKQLIIFNDDVNSFEKVIGLLMLYLKHSFLQAQQCAHIIHNNGKYCVKLGKYDELIIYKNKLVEAGLNAVVL